MKRMLLSLAVLGGAAQLAEAARFEATRDTFIDGHSSARNFGSGKEIRDRIGKDATSPEESFVVDFNSTEIQTFMTNNPLGPGQGYKAVLYIKPHADWSATATSVTLGTLNLAQDWTEGTGIGTADFQWNAGTADATYHYAQHYLKFDTDGTTKITDTANSVKWTAPDGTTQYTNYFAVPFGIQNSQQFVASSANHEQYVGVELDSTVLNDLATNSMNRGLFFRGPNHNGRVWGIDATNTNTEPYLDITVVAIPEPAAMSLLAVGGLMALRRRRQV